MDSLFVTMAAAATAMEAQPSPFSYSAVTYLWVIIWSAAGGVVSFMRKVKEGSTRPFNLMELIGELCTSGFVGVLTFWFCEWAKVPPLLSAMFIGITGHMGSRVLFVAEKALESWFRLKYGICEPTQHHREGDSK